MISRLEPPGLPDWLGNLIPFDRYRVELADGVEVHVMEQGEGRPVLAFHGNPTWGFLYRKVAAQLAGEPFRVIMPDLVGLGLSDRVERSRYTLANHSSWMAELVRMLDLSDAITVVQDWGGPIGLRAMAANPGLMTGLVVMNTSIGPPRPGFKPTTFHRVFSTPIGELLSRYLGLPHRRLGFAQGDRDSISGVVQRAYNFPLRGKGGHEAVIELVRMVPDSMDHPSVPLLEEVAEFVGAYEGKAAIVWGDEDPVLGRLRSRVSRALPQAKVTATQAGHFLQEEVPHEIAAAIRSVA